ncbi:DUF4446 family protein [Paenibacillus sp. GCM10012307]|uniref:DUF4446 family protein n=1 Tax=Paenibacillus roseus TaxID=2798579 RepID=A0A934J1Q5_9BACL|nr:DUF4446 family protein [Paenibacillus roseus]MBJ6361679.1 DUF4446 family protein [Paenibacillus roseus]
MSEVSTSISVEAWVVAAAGAFMLLLFVWLMVLSIRFGKMRRRYKKMMADTGIDNLEQLIEQLQHNDQLQQNKLQLQVEQLQLMKESLAQVKGRVGIHRYNAFSDQGSDLSFSLAIMNDKQDGVIISGIHGRDETYVYAKPLKQGESAYPLSPEERKAVGLALQQG